MARHFADGIMIEYPDELDQNTIAFTWRELPPSIVREMAQRLWDANPSDPRVVQLNELYKMLMGD